MITTAPRRLAPIALLAIAAALTGCEGGDMEVNGQKGVPLAEIEIAGPPPSEIILSSGDTVIVTEGNTFALTVEGANTDSLRFVRDPNVIAVMREPGWSGESNAVIRVTMPAPKEIVIGGSGTVQTPAVASTAEITIGGSGTVEFGRAAAEKLAINIGGSGTVRGAGTAKTLEVMIGGTGDVELPGLKVDTAEVTIGGNGDVAFASDGTVEANIFGSGDVNVAGNAKCTLNSAGAGALNCARTGSGASGAIPAAAPAVPVAPQPPAAPKPAG